MYPERILIFRFVIGTLRKINYEISIKGIIRFDTNFCCFAVTEVEDALKTLIEKCNRTGLRFHIATFLHTFPNRYPRLVNKIFFH